MPRCLAVDRLSGPLHLAWPWKLTLGQISKHAPPCLPAQAACVLTLLESMQVAGTNFLPQLLAWVGKENLPDYIGGTSTATLIDDAGPWQDPAIIAEA